MSRKIETNAIRSRIEKTHFREHTTPIFLTSGFTFDNADHMRAAFADEVEAHLYSRFTNPNNDELIQKMNVLEGTEAGFSFATGMAAIFTSIAALVECGDHIISCRSIFGSTHNIFTKYFPKWGIKTDFFDADDVESIRDMIRTSTKMIFLETPTNPGMQILDLERIGQIARDSEILFVVDNTFATPIITRPVEYGADIILHSATKLIDGQGRVLGGVSLGRKELIHEIYLFARNTGPAMSPFHSWLLSKSIETLPLRVERQSKNAEIIARKIETLKGVSGVSYPFLSSHPQYELAKRQMKYGGNMISFILKDGLEAGARLIDGLQLCSRSANLGDTRTIVTHPALTTHKGLTEKERLDAGIFPGLIRVSVGLEDPQDIIDDLVRTLV